MKVLTLTLSLSKGERRPQAAKGEAGSSHVFDSLVERTGGPGRRSNPNRRAARPGATKALTPEGPFPSVRDFARTPPVALPAVLMVAPEAPLSGSGLMKAQDGNGR